MAKIRAGSVRFEIAIEPHLHKRLKTICEKMHIPIRHLVLDATAERVEFLEEKQRKEEERLKAEREAAGGRVKFAGFRRMSASTLASPAKPTPLGEKVVEAPKPKELPIEYATYAQKIYAALIGGSALEVRLVTLESVAEIKKRFPLSHPQDEVIVSTLESLVLEMRENATVVTREETPEVVIDTSKVKTFGNVTPEAG